MQARINPSLACFPSLSFERATERVVAGVEEGVLGRLEASVIQLVPQCYGILDEQVCERVRALAPGRELRLHANVRMHDKRIMADLSGLHLFPSYFERLRALNAFLSAPVYTAHAGRRSEASFTGLLRNAQELSDTMGCVVGIEGHYPTPHNTFLVSGWVEYRRLFESNQHYVLDLSHIHILACQSHERDDGLLREMLASPRCVEVHLSSNDGKSDSHFSLEEEPWWFHLLQHAHPDAVFFTEGRASRR